MKTISLSQLKLDDLAGSICTSVSGSNITIWYRGDALPANPPQAIDQAAIEAAREKDAAEATAAASYAKLKALTQMSPDQVQTWVAANVTNLAQAQDAITTLAIAVSVLARRL